MRLRNLPITMLAFLALAGCQKEQPARLKVLIGATTIAAPGATPLVDSIIVIAGTKIRAVGPRKDVPVPQASDRTDFTGEWIVPAKGSRIEAGETANLLILKNVPDGVTPNAPGDIGARITAGDWESLKTK